MKQHKEFLAMLIAVITLAVSFATFLSRQAVVETQLAHIQRDLAVISEQLTAREETSRDLSERVVHLETMVRNLERNLDGIAGR